MAQVVEPSKHDAMSSNLINKRWYGLHPNRFWFIDSGTKHGNQNDCVAHYIPFVYFSLFLLYLITIKIKHHTLFYFHSAY
jgi:hypothetical protein